MSKVQHIIIEGKPAVILPPGVRYLKRYKKKYKPVNKNPRARIVYGYNTNK